MSYINREDALSFPFANDQYNHDSADFRFIIGCESYKEWLESLPAYVFPDGHWVKYKSKKTGKTFVRCSQCKRANPSKYLTRFCPNCGAIMERRTKNDD